MSTSEHCAVFFFNERCSAHNQPSTDSLICANSFAFFLCVIRLCTAATVELRMLCKCRRNSLFHLVARTDQSISFRYWVWDQVTHQSKKNYEFDDHIFAIPTKVNGKNTTEPEREDEFEENYMTVYVKTITGKTITIKRDKKQKAGTISGKIEVRTAIPRGITCLNDKKTMEESTIEAEPTIEMSLRLLGGVEKLHDGLIRIRRTKKKEQAGRNE